MHLDLWDVIPLKQFILDVTAIYPPVVSLGSSVWVCRVRGALRFGVRTWSTRMVAPSVSVLCTASFATFRTRAGTRVSADPLIDSRDPLNTSR